MLIAVDAVAANVGNGNSGPMNSDSATLTPERQLSKRQKAPGGPFALGDARPGRSPDNRRL